MGFDKVDVIQALQTIGCKATDDQQYVAGLLTREFQYKEDEELDSAAERVNELLGSFLWDWKLVSSEAESVKLSKSVLVLATGQAVEDEDAEALTLRRLKVPCGSLRVRDLIRVKVERRPIEAESAVAAGAGASQVEVAMASQQGCGYEDPFLGMEKVQNGQFNVVIPIEESMKIAKAAAKKREKQLRMMRQWEKSRVPLPPPRRRHGDQTLSKLKDIMIPTFSVAVAGRELLKDAELKLVLGHRYGLIGRNGIGKTTFLSALVRKEIPGVDKDINIGCVEQDFDDHLDYTPLESVLRVDEERVSLVAEEHRLSQEEESEEVGKRLAWLYRRLEEIDADKAEAQACMILDGLGLSVKQYKEMKIRELSGGWRARVMLARVLFADTDIVCLDEPTNHMDIHAVAWLTQYLRQSTKTIIVVSHSRQFLNDVCTDIMEFKDRKLAYYSGDYDVFERAKADKEMHLQREIESQQGKVAHIQKFIDRFRYNAKRASLVQSRIKQLQKLPMLESITDDPQLQFKFMTPAELPTPILIMQGVNFSYAKSAKKAETGKAETGKAETGKAETGTAETSEDDLLLRNVDFSADLTTRAAICGVNGSGKSTFLKLLLGQLEPVEGFVFRHNKLKIGHFAQHHVDGLDLTKNAVQQLQEKYPDAKLTDAQARSYLGRFGISGLLALEPMFILSGGQKSRVAIALMAFDEPHILVLDEPTNHLDLDAVQALIAALNTFEGGVIIVSHDTHLLSCATEDVYHLEPKTQTLQRFKGDFEEYRQQVLKRKI
ncbi:putative ABC transporter [Gregarina niphandrodes]|uniref:ABC transporter n=1 Tax=Gregarina niphandrodes TaxID=110365 RepID=A0A023B408_GRENI|nr:putative ABC transporter [Gregarina niphandrodes]EZG56103.1 putative ABC transporter [Gregarina niphandrodes]|eukprot:XP_011131336.1 putative ABC transporter [Gregarina niphandrodes]